MSRALPWDDIRFFLAVARERSVSKAASALGVNYTTVVRRIDAFEARLEMRLFERLAGGYVMTAPAEAVYAEASSMEERALAFDRALFGHDQKLLGRLRVATSDAVATRLLVPNLARFTDHHPAIELELLTSDSLVDLDLREADIAVRMSGAPPEHLIGQRISGLAYAVYASKRYHRAHGVLDDPAVQLLTWVGEQPTSWREPDFARATLGPRFDSPLALLAAIHAGLGVGLLPCFLAASERSLVRLGEPIEYDWGLWVLSHPDTRTTARLRAFRGFLVETLAGQRSKLLGGAEAV